MSLAIFQKFILDDRGNVQPFALVEVRKESDNTLATLYSDRAGVSPTSNPVSASAEGLATFYVEGGAYKVTASLNGQITILRYVANGLAQEVDYSEGLWTPTLTFATPGDLAVGYSGQQGQYVKVGKLVHAWFRIVTSSFTHSTASGNLVIAGLPFTSGSDVPGYRGGTMVWGGVTKANYTDVAPTVSAGTQIGNVNALGSGQSASTITAADMPSGGNVNMSGLFIYPAAT